MELRAVTRGWVGTEGVRKNNKAGRQRSAVQQRYSQARRRRNDVLGNCRHGRPVIARSLVKTGASDAVYDAVYADGSRRSRQSCRRAHSHA